MILPDRIWPRATTGRSAVPEPEPSDTPITHVVLTRFNFRIYRDRKDLGEGDNHARWLTHRIEQWSRVCLPSMLGQQRRPTRWVLGLSGAEREAVAPVLEAIKPHRWIVPAWQEEGETPSKVFTRAMADLPDPHPWVATTRLDNDDALALDYVAKIERYGRRAIDHDPTVDDFWVAFGLGAQLVEGRCLLYPYSDPPFLTRFRRGGKVNRTVNSIKHTALYEQPEPVHVVWTRHPMWLQNIHEENLLNKAKEQQLELAPTQEALKLFGLDVARSWKDKVPDRLRQAWRSRPTRSA